MWVPTEGFLISYSFCNSLLYTKLRELPCTSESQLSYIMKLFCFRHTTLMSLVWTCPQTWSTLLLKHMKVLKVARCVKRSNSFFSANLEIFCVTWSKNNIHLLYWKGPIWSKWCLNKRVPCWKIWCSIQQRDHSSYKGQKSPSQEDSGETYLAYCL